MADLENGKQKRIHESFGLIRVSEYENGITFANKNVKGIKSSLSGQGK